MPAEKKAFAWDNEKHLGFLEVNSRKQIEVKRVSMEGKREMILLTEWKYFKNKQSGNDDWNAVKGMTVPMSSFMEASVLVATELLESPEIEIEEEEADNE